MPRKSRPPVRVSSPSSGTSSSSSSQDNHGNLYVRTEACLRSLGVHTLRSMERLDVSCAAEPLPSELRGWCIGDSGDSRDKLSELRDCLVTWMVDAQPTKWWSVLTGCARRGTRHLEQSLVFCLWHTMINHDDASVKLESALCYARLLCMPGSTAHRVFQQEAYLCALDICIPPDLVSTKRKRSGGGSTSMILTSEDASAFQLRASLLASILKSTDNFPLRNHYTIRDAFLETITTIVGRCSAQDSWSDTFSDVISNAIIKLLNPLQGNSLRSAVSLLLGLVPAITASQSLSSASTSVPHSVSKSHDAALSLSLSIIQIMAAANRVEDKDTSQEDSDLDHKVCENMHTDGGILPPEHLGESSSMSSHSSSQHLQNQQVSTRLTLALIKKLCEDAPERATRRGLVLAGVIKVIEYTQKNIGLSSSMKRVYSLLNTFSRSKAMSQRLFSVEVCVALIQKSNYNRQLGPLFATIIARTEDKVPRVRAKAMQSIANVLESSAERDGEEIETGAGRKAQLCVCIQQQFVNTQGQLSSRLSKCLEDSSSTVRRQACRILAEATKVLLESAVAFCDDNSDTSESDMPVVSSYLYILVVLCGKDPSPSVRGEAMAQLSSLLEFVKENEVLSSHQITTQTARAWALGAMPLVGDPEASVQTKCVRNISTLLLDPLIDGASIESHGIRGHSDAITTNERRAREDNASLAWRLINTLSDDAIMCFQRAIELSLASKLHSVDTLVDAMQTWLHKSDGEDSITLKDAGSWIILEALTKSIHKGNDDEGLPLDCSLVVSHWDSQMRFLKQDLKKKDGDLFKATNEIKENNDTKDCMGKHKMDVATLVRLLAVLQNVASVLKASEAERLCKDMMSLLEDFEAPLDLLNGIIRTAYALNLRSQAIRDNDGNVSASVLQCWCGPLVSKCGAILRDYVLHDLSHLSSTPDCEIADVTKSSVGSQRSTVQSERDRAVAKAIAENARVVRVLFTLGEIALVGVVREQGDGGDAPEGSVIAGQGTIVRISNSIIAAVQILLAPDLVKDGVDSLSGETTSVKLQIPTPVRAHAFVALGKLCLRDRNLTKEFVPLFARELQNTSTPNSIRNNILIIFGDLCTRFTSQLSQYVPNMAACLQDREPVIRRHSLLLLVQLLRRDYIRLRPGVFFRLAAVLADPLPELRERAEHMLTDMFLVKQPKLFLNNFLQTIAVFTGCRKYNVNSGAYKKSGTNMEVGMESCSAPLQDVLEEVDFKDLSTFHGVQSRERRRTVYKYLLCAMTDEHKLELSAKICRDVLGQMPDDSIILSGENLDSMDIRASEEMVRDVLAVLRTKEIKVGSTSRMNALGRAEAAAAEDNDALAATEAAKGAVLSKLSHKHILQITVPELVRLKREFESLHSPLLEDLMEYFVFLYRSGQEIRDIISSSFPTISSEIEYDIKQFEKEREEAASKAATSATNKFNAPMDFSTDMDPLIIGGEARGSTESGSDMLHASTHGDEPNNTILISKKSGNPPIDVANELVDESENLVTLDQNEENNQALAEEVNKSTKTTAKNGAASLLFKKEVVLDPPGIGPLSHQKQLNSNSPHLSGIKQLQTPRRSGILSRGSSLKKKTPTPRTPHGTLVDILTSTPGNMGTPVLKSRNTKRSRLSTSPLSLSDKVAEPRIVRSAAKSWASKKYFQRQIQANMKGGVRKGQSMLSVLAPPEVIMKSPGLFTRNK